jgi:predicted nicotinamide N-methyase
LRDVTVEFVDDAVRVGEVELSLRRPAEPEALLERGGVRARRVPALLGRALAVGLALARALPDDLRATTVVELGSGLGIPSLVAAARGADVLAVDWAGDAIELLRENAARNRLHVRAEVADWRDFDGTFDLVLAADVLYERRNVEPLLALLPRLAPRVLLAEPGRPYFGTFLEAPSASGRSPTAPTASTSCDAAISRVFTAATRLGPRGA